MAFYCGGLPPGAQPDGWKVKSLNLWPKAGRTNVHLEVTQLYDKFWRNLPAHYEDFLEIAAYVYSGDQAMHRVSDNDLNTMCSMWRRTFHYHIPVRAPEFWNSAEVKQTLQRTLEFLAEDYFDFTFYGAANAPEVQTFLGIETAAGKFSRPERLALFSGGLDSLAGVVAEAIGKKRKLLLLNHRSNDKFSPLYETLFQQLTDRVNPVPLSQVRVLINKSATLGIDFAQRARSFLFAAMGMTVASILKLDEITCFENGVVSLNLPVCAQITGAKATRTTHPRVIRGLEKLGTLLAGGKDFKIRTPFFWHTKGDVVAEILKEKCGPLIASSRSCAGTILRSKIKPHCGVCSQCIDRRVGMIAAGAADFDPASSYEIDVFSDSLPKIVDKIMAAEFVNRAFELENFQNADEFIGEYPEVSLALPYMELDGGTRAGLAERILKLYKRHAVEVETALEKMQLAQAKAGRRGSLPADCLTRIMLDPASVTVVPAVPVNGHAIPATGAEPQNNPILPVPPYLLRRGVGLWKVVYDGNEGEIDLGRGISLVAYLLFNPPLGGLHGTELAKRVFGQEILQEASLGADSDSTRRKIEIEAIKWNSVMKDPEASESEKAEALEELQNLADALNVTRMNSEGGADKQVRAIRRAIDRLIEKLREAKDRQNNPHPALRAFGEHLHKHLWIPSSRFSGDSRSRARAGVAGQFTYERPADVVWVE